MQVQSDSDQDSEPSVQSPPQLAAIELRVLGVLMEKQLTTPDQYPLTVNSILNACNQKSSRDPVTSYEQGELVRALHGLEGQRFIRKEYGSRSDKYSQQFTHQLALGKKHQAVLCLLILRGPQTLSELNTRTQRMEQFTDKDDLTHCIERLCKREVPYVIRLGSQPGQRGERFGHLFSGTPEVTHSQPTATVNDEAPAGRNDDQETLMILESEVADLNKAIRVLRSENELLRDQLERLYELTGHPLLADAE